MPIANKPLAFMAADVILCFGKKLVITHNAVNLKPAQEQPSELQSHKTATKKRKASQGA